MASRYDDDEDDELMMTPRRSEPIRSRSDQLKDYMKALGFKAKPARTDGTIEYAKTYTDASSRMGRLVAVFKLDDIGLEPERPDYFAATSQVYVKGTQKEAETMAPAFARADILKIISIFDSDADDHGKHQPYKCAGCNESTDEYIQVGAENICYRCARSRGL
jgi:hypothetical protein